MTWTAVSDVTVDQPALASWANAVKNNIPALAAGDSGAPRIQTAALNDQAVTNAKIADGTINGDQKFGDGTVTPAKFQECAPGTLIVRRVKEGTTAYNNGSYNDALLYDNAGFETWTASCIRPGSLNVYMIGRILTGTMFFRVLINSTQVYESAIGVTTFELREANVSLTYGDRLTIQHRGGDYEVREIYLRSSTFGICVV